MSKLRMERKASDNKYFHRDFHISSDRGIRYVGENFGDDAVITYLEKFTKAYYKPLIEKIKTDGLSALEAHIRHIYEVEEAPDDVETSLCGGALSVKIKKCPAVSYMKSQGYEPSKWYAETTKTVNRVIAEECGCTFELASYDESDGAAQYTFYEEGKR